MNIDNYNYATVAIKWKKIDNAPVDKNILLAAVTMTDVMFVGIGKIVRRHNNHQAVGFEDIEWVEITIKDQFKDKMHLNWGVSKWWPLPDNPLKIKLML